MNVPHVDRRSPEHDRRRYVSQEQVIKDEAIIRKYWGLYDEAFGSLRLKSPVRQAFTEDEFWAEMVDPRVLKFILWEHGEPIGIALVATDLAAVPWISVPYYAARFPEEFADKTLFYFGALMTVNHAQLQQNTEVLLAELVNFVVAQDGVALFDCSDPLVEFMPDHIERETRKQAEMDRHELGSQTYFAYKARGFKKGFGKGAPFGTGNVTPIR